MLETLGLEDAVKVAVEMTSEEDTLILFTADHGHPLMINGYADRGSDITGKDWCFSSLIKILFL